MAQNAITVETSGRELIDITPMVQAVVAGETTAALCNVFVPHTSASLILNENWDPDVQRDLQAFFKRLVPDGDMIFSHTAEGPDDMPAHVRTALTQNSITIPMIDGRLCLGSWQGIFLWEHRTAPHQRKVIITYL